MRFIKDRYRSNHKSITIPTKQYISKNGIRD